jgi:TRAP transporter TAXI family solute receptor
MQRLSNALRLLWALPLLVATAEAQELRLATGPENGVYHMLGQAIQTVLAKDGITLVLTPTDGSQDNLNLLKDGTVDLALTQHDVLADVLAETATAPPPPTVLLALAEEPLHIVVAPPVTGDGLVQLAGFTIATGLEKSGSRFTSERVLGGAVSFHHGPSPRPKDYNTLVESLRSSKVHALCFISGVPAPKVAELLTDQRFKLLSLTPDDLHNLTGRYRATSIRGLEYARRMRPVTTISVMTLLVSSPRHAGESVVKKLLEAVLRDLDRDDSHLATVGHGHVSLGSVLRLTRDVRGLSKPSLRVHPHTAVAVQRLPWTSRFRETLNHVYVLLLLSIAAILFTLSASQEIRRRFGSAIASGVPAGVALSVRRFFNFHIPWLVARATSLLIIIWIAGAFVMFQFERDYSVHFASFYDSLISLLVYLFSGLEDRSPVTDPGWAGAVVMLLLAGMTMAYMTGAFASALITSTTGAFGSRILTMKDHVVIVGWNRRGERIVHILLNASYEGFGEQRITILSEGEPAIHVPTEWEANVSFVRGRGLDEDSLNHAQVALARCVLVLAEEKSEDPDGLSALRILAVSHCRSRPGGTPLICAEVMDATHTEILRRAGADEVICHEQYGLGLLAQFALQNRVTQVFDELLTLREGSCEVYRCSEWNPQFAGMTFSELSTMFSQRRGEGALILIGIQRGSEWCINPREDILLQKGDALVVIARVYPALKKLAS